MHGIPNDALSLLYSSFEISGFHGIQHKCRRYVSAVYDGLGAGKIIRLANVVIRHERAPEGGGPADGALRNPTP
jgi:hypothetical protein